MFEVFHEILPVCHSLICPMMLSILSFTNLYTHQSLWNDFFALLFLFLLYYSYGVGTLSRKVDEWETPESPCCKSSFNIFFQLSVCWRQVFHFYESENWISSLANRYGCHSLDSDVWYIGVPALVGVLFIRLVLCWLVCLPFKLTGSL